MKEQTYLKIKNELKEVLKPEFYQELELFYNLDDYIEEVYTENLENESYIIRAEDTASRKEHIIKLELEDYEEFIIFDLVKGVLYSEGIQGLIKAEHLVPDVEPDNYEILPSK